MEAIKLKIAYYAIKPINTSELLDNISDYCMAEQNKELRKRKIFVKLLNIWISSTP